MCTGAGNDRVVEERRSFDEIRINLGPGDDTILIARNSWPTVAPGPGDDLIRAVDVRRAAFTTTCVRLGSATGPVRVNLALGRATGQGRDRLVNIRCVGGSRFNDVLIGTPRNDSIDAGGGLDLVRTGAGNDDVYGGDRADEVHLGPRDDDGNGAYGWDRLYGGPGADAVTGGPDGDYIDGGTGDDYLYAGVACDGSYPPGSSTAWMLIEMLTNGGPNEVFGRTGNDFLAGDRGNDRLDGGTGIDSGTGGYHDGRIDWITSLERFDECDSP